MEQDEQLFHKIEDYLDGNMQESDQKEFEEQLASDTDLQEIVKKHRFEREGIEYLFVQDLRQKMKTWDASATSTETKIEEKKTTTKIIIWGFILLLGIGGAWWILKNYFSTPTLIEPAIENPTLPTLPPPPKPKPTDKPIAEEKNKIEEPTAPSATIDYLALAKKEYELPEDLIINLRSFGTEKMISTLKEGLEAFKNNDFKNAILALEKISATQNPTEHNIAKKYLAHAYFQVNNFPAAALAFQNLANESLLPEEYEWYFTLSLLPSYSKNKKTIKFMLNRMIDPEEEHEFADKAKEINSQLLN